MLWNSTPRTGTNFGGKQRTLSFPLNVYNTFKDLGLQALAPHGYKKIWAHLVYDVKHNGHHKARMVADGHLTTVPVDSVYSGVVSQHGIRMLVFLAELNGLQTWCTDIGNAYLEAEMKEKVFFVAGPEFGDLAAGHTLVIVKALHGLRTSRARWHDRFVDCLCDMGFEPSKGEPDIWMQRNGDIYEYIGVNVDDLAIVAKDPWEIVDVLKWK
jgi:Reverse transcriptase (RNA-dependent DNA polymerase)